MTALLENLKRNSLKTIQNYHTINFPAYKLPAEPILKDGLVFSEGRLIDDRNVEGANLGRRRLLSPQKFSSLTSIKENIVDLIKDSTSTEEWYIDYSGNGFKYKKTTVEKLVCHKIKKVLFKDTYSILVVNNVNFPIIVERPPTGAYARILYFADHPWKLYDVIPEKVKSSSKKV
jgi:hypothetical protein